MIGDNVPTVANVTLRVEAPDVETAIARAAWGYAELTDTRPESAGGRRISGNVFEVWFRWRVET